MAENKVKIAVLVSGGGTNLQALIDSQSNGVLNSGEIVLVVSSKPEVYALERAKNASIPSVVVSRQAYGDDIDGFGHEILTELKKHGVELIVLGGFLSMLSSELCAEYKDRIINVHPSLIPSFCGKGFYGLRVHRAALDYGVKVSGATVHFVDEEYDHGKIIMQKAVEVEDGDTPETLQLRIMKECEQVILPRAVEKVCAGLLGSR